MSTQNARQVADKIDYHCAEIDRYQAARDKLEPSSPEQMLYDNLALCHFKLVAQLRASVDIDDLVTL